MVWCKSKVFHSIEVTQMVVFLGSNCRQLSDAMDSGMPNLVNSWPRCCIVSSAGHWDDLNPLGAGVNHDKKHLVSHGASKIDVKSGPGLGWP